MRLDVAALVELTDDLLATEQELPRFVVAAWADALACAPAPLVELDDPEPR